MEDGSTIDPSDLPVTEKLSLEIYRPYSASESFKVADDYKEFIGSLRTKVTFGCVKLVRGLRSVTPNAREPFFLVPITVYDGRKFETSVIIEGSDLYVVVFRSGEKYYELIEGKQRFKCDRAPSRIKKSYSQNAPIRDISPKAFMNAVIYLAKDEMHSADDDYEGIQEALDTIYWYLSEPARFARIFRKHRSFFCNYAKWEDIREKPTADHELIGAWSKLCDEVRVSVATKTNHLNITDVEKKLIEVADVNVAVDLTLGVLSKDQLETDGKRRRKVS